MSKKNLEKIIWGLNFRRKKPTDVSRNEFLKTVLFFESLKEKQLKKLASYLHERRYEENEYLFEVNHPGAALFIIMRGEVAVELPDDHGEVTQFAVIKAGEFLGEMALSDESPRSASARALRPTTTLALFRGDLNQLAQVEPEIACEIYKTLSWIIGERLKATNRNINLVKKGA